MLLVPAIVIGSVFLMGAVYEGITTLRDRREARNQAIRNDPGDYARSRLAQARPRFLKLGRAHEEANTALTDATDAKEEIEANLEKAPPPRTWAFGILFLSSLWLVSFVVQYLLDFRIARAVTGQVGSAALTALVISGTLTAITLIVALAWDRRVSIPARRLRLQLLVAAALFFGVLSLIVLMAPKRAELDFADRIDTTKSSIAMFDADGDKEAADLARTKLERLETERDQAAKFYQVVAVVVGLLEGASSFAVPTGYLLINYYGARGQVRAKTKQVAKAANTLARARDRFAARLARDFERAGVRQDLLNLGGDGGGPGGAPPGLRRGPIALAGPAPVQAQTDPAPQDGGPVAPTGGGAGPRPPRRGPRRPGRSPRDPGQNAGLPPGQESTEGPDPTFDQA